MLGRVKGSVSALKRTWWSRQPSFQQPLLSRKPQEPISALGDIRRLLGPTFFASSSTSDPLLPDDDDDSESPPTHGRRTTVGGREHRWASTAAHQRVWRAVDPNQPGNGGSQPSASSPSTWTDRVIDRADGGRNLSDLLDRISAQQWQGGRMRNRLFGVLHEDPVTDMELLTQNYTVTAVASALRDREDALQQAAVLAGEERWDELKQMLSIFHPKYVLERRSQQRLLNLSKRWDSHALELLRKALMRMPRTVTQAHSRRAGVVVALCSVDGVPSLMLEKRSSNTRAHPDEVCLPGGMYCEISDRTIVATCLREMKEEIDGLDNQNVQVLGVFRCNWGEVHHLVGVAVTPVVCFLGELPDRLVPCQREVAEVFTIPLESLLDKSLWVYKEGLAPIFLGGPYVIWGLTGYILDRFCKDILLPNSRPQEGDDL